MAQDCPDSVVTWICTWSFRSGKKLNGLNWQAACAGIKPITIRGAAIDADFQNVMLPPVKLTCRLSLIRRILLAASVHRAFSERLGAIHGAVAGTDQFRVRIALFDRYH